MEEIELGKYRIFLSENEVAVKRNEETIYRGKLYDTLFDFIERIRSLPKDRQEYELELAFNI